MTLVGQSIPLSGVLPDPTKVETKHDIVIVSDHGALKHLVKITEHHPLVQRWVEFCSAYHFKLECRKGSGHTNADFVSRLPVDATQSDTRGESLLTRPSDFKCSLSVLLDFFLA